MTLQTGECLGFLSSEVTVSRDNAVVAPGLQASLSKGEIFTPAALLSQTRIVSGYSKELLAGLVQTMSKVTSRFQVTMPKKIADRYAIRPGDEIDWVAAGDVIRVISWQVCGRA